MIHSPPVTSTANTSSVVVITSAAAISTTSTIASTASPTIVTTVATLASTVVTDPTDVRISWVYSLKKDELQLELAKFGLDTAGTVDILRKRLASFIRMGKATPSPATQAFVFPTISTGITTASVASTLANTIISSSSVPICTSQLPNITMQPPTPTSQIQSPTPSNYSTSGNSLKVHKWNVHFNGRSDPVTFIERLQEICTSQGIAIDRLLPHMPELLEGDASLWYRNNRSHWNTWDDFLQDFRSFYYPVNYAADLEIEISRRLQRQNEPSHRYITDLQTLIRRHGGINPDQELQWLYRNLLPEYRQYIRKSDAADVISLSRTIRETELLLSELHSKPSTSRSSYQSPAGLSTAHVASRTSPPTRTRFSNPHNQSQRPSGPHGPSTRNPNNARTNNICWRCGETGHVRTECQGPARLFCSRCGRNGIMSRDCTCTRRRSEN